MAAHGGLLVHRGHRQHRLAGVDRFVGERLLAHRVGADRLAEVGHGVGRRRQLAGAQDRLHAGHRLGGARVDAAHARVRQRAQQQLGEEHAVGAEVLGVRATCR